jgi:methyl-accepting chemotaxis protein
VKNIAIMHKLMMVIGAFVLFILTIVGATFHVVSQQSDDARLIDIAARQRTLSLAVVGDFAALSAALESESSTTDARSALTGKVELFSKSLSALSNGSQVPDSEGAVITLPPPSAAVLAQLQKVHQLWSKFEAAAKVVLADKVNVTSTAYYAAGDDVRAVKNALFEESNKATLMLMRESLAKNQTLEAILAVAMLLTLVAAVAGYIVSRQISVPLVTIGSLMSRAAAGDHSVAVPFDDRGDEIGGLARAFRVFKDNAIETERLRAEAEQNRVAQEAAEQQQRQAAEARRLEKEAEKERRRQAEEKLRAEQEAEKERQRQVELARADRLNQLMRSFDAKVTGLLQAVTAAATELQATATSMASTAEEASRQATTVAAATEQASANVQTVATAADELSASIQEIARQVAHSTQTSGKAVTESERTAATMKELVAAAQRIGKVVELIAGIAGQTNLLALNATIEAARAGEAGKGFAVVASEVKTLANQTAKATEEIGQQIASMQQATEQAMKAIDGISATVGENSEVAATIASAVEEQGAATQEIARNVQQAAAGTSEVSNNIGGVTKAATDTGAAASQVLSSAGELAKQAKQLRGEVDSFLAAVKAA